jgi:DNA-binding NtrC family response regulator
MTTRLYFDDEEALLTLFREAFGDRHKVRTASTLAEARRELASCAPDVVISDWSMAESTGVEFLREAARACPGSFRVLLTGQGHVGDFIAELGAGVVQLFITKPWTEGGMRKALERAGADKRGARLKP